MKGSIRKMGTGYNVTMDIGIDEKTGKRIQKRKSGFRTMEDAQNFIDDMKKKLDEGIQVSKDIMFQDFTKEFMEIEGPKLAPKTKLSYNQHIDRYFNPYFKQFKLSSIKPTHIEKYLNKLRSDGGLKGRDLSGTSINYQFRLLKRFFNLAIKWKYLRYSPCTSVEAPKKSRKKNTIWTVLDLKDALPELVNSPIFIHIFLAIKTGMREGEICALKWSAIDFKNGIIKVEETVQLVERELIFKDTKTTDSDRAIYIDTDTVKTLKSYKSVQSENQLALGDGRDKTYDGYMSVWPDGKFMHPDYVGKRFSKDIVKYNLKKTRFHDLRHLHATVLLAAGNDIKIISERLGHADINTTADIYTHVDISLQKKAMAKFSKLVKSAK